MTPRQGLRYAIALFGSEARLAAAIDYSTDGINEAKKRGKVTAEMAVNIERVTEKRVTRLMLRPDLFGNGNGLVKNSWARGNRRHRPERRR
jgi:DNA-binding transcriptional regulator YdaS (Cro superfamily)